MLAEPLDHGRAALAVDPRRLVLKAVRLGRLANPKMEPCNLAVADDLRLGSRERQALNGFIGQQDALGLGRRHGSSFARVLHV
jgi:hypothetical protein